MQTLGHIGLLYFVTEVKLFASIVLVLNMFLKKLKHLLRIKNIIANIFRVQANNSVMHGYFCIGLIYFMVAGKKLTDFTDWQKHNDNRILSYFRDEWN